MIDVTRDQGVATVRMGHGPVNAMDRELLDAVEGEITALDRDPEVRAMVLAGNERAFCAGVDLRRILDEDATYTREFLAALGRALLAPLQATTPVVAAVTGHAIAGGAILAAACDHVVMTDTPSARIGLAELSVGVPFPAAAIEIMRRRLGPGLGPAVWLAELPGPDEAVARGFVDEVVPGADVVGRAREVAGSLARVPDATLRLTHEQLAREVTDAVAERAPDWDDRVADAWCSPEGRDAIRRFVERTLG